MCSTWTWIFDIFWTKDCLSDSAIYKSDCSSYMYRSTTQMKWSGCVSITDISKVATNLLRNTASAQIITLALKRRLSDNHPYHQQLIRSSYVNEPHSPLYSQVQGNPNWQQDSYRENQREWILKSWKKINPTAMQLNKERNITL